MKIVMGKSNILKGNKITNGKDITGMTLSWAQSIFELDNVIEPNLTTLAYMVTEDGVIELF